jgi:hypothetical protein
MADELMILNKSVLDSLNIQKNSDLYEDKGLQLKYKEAMDKYMFTAIPNDKFPLDYKIHDILEDENEHLLNQHLYLNGSFGEDKKNKWVDFLGRVNPDYIIYYLDKDVYDDKKDFVLQPKPEKSNEQKELKEAIDTFEMLVSLGGTKKELKEWNEAIETFKMLLDSDVKNSEYDKAFDKMYKEVISSDKHIKEQNKLIDNWIKENAPKYGIEQFAKGGEIQTHIQFDSAILETVGKNHYLRINGDSWKLTDNELINLKKELESYSNPLSAANYLANINKNEYQKITIDKPSEQQTLMY